MNWNTKKSKHYIFHFFKDSFAEKEIDIIIENQEKEYDRILKYLGTENGRVINYYIYPDNETKEKITGKTGNASSNWKTFVIDVVYNENKKCIGAHEETHLLAAKLGTATILFREGLAVFMSGIWWGEPLENMY